MTKRTATRREAPPVGPQAGFTLVEALVAIVILIFGLIAVTNLMLVAASSSSVANQATGAATVASQQLETLKARPFDLLNAATGGDVDSDVSGFNRDDDIPGVGRIHTRWQVISVDTQALFIRVRSEGTGALSAARSRAEFSTLRSCTNTALGCP